ncbi:hypothetical protein NECAME_08563 [Necator americanus]|uniref:Protein kinase domain-containing protein n=1 Tax=Necator americanus TaxID=51031 RepID=W2TK27_NECAM|nr:hypothetical protein NECAME_08563 [Necator americanus]ETN81342.1 hypothetical protein NECAME_08563 [Necator americanus]
MEMVLSVLHDPTGRFARVKKATNRANCILHLVIQSKIKAKYCIDNGAAFDSVNELIQYFSKNTIKMDIRLGYAIPLAPWEIEAKHVTIGDILGGPGWLELRKCTIKVLGEDIRAVATVIYKSPLANEAVKELARQCRLLRELQYPCIIRFYGVCLVTQPCYFFMEFFSEGKLNLYLIKHRGNLKRDELLQMVMSAGWGLDYLHSQGILHRDLAARNCYYNKQMIKKGKTNVFPAKTPKTLADYVKQQMWEINPNNRSSMKDIMEYLSKYTGFKLETGALGKLSVQRTLTAPVTNDVDFEVAAEEGAAQPHVVEGLVIGGGKPSPGTVLPKELDAKLLKKPRVKSVEKKKTVASKEEPKIPLQLEAKPLDKPAQTAAEQKKITTTAPQVTKEKEPEKKSAVQEQVVVKPAEEDTNIAGFANQAGDLLFAFGTALVQAFQGGTKSETKSQINKLEEQKTQSLLVSEVTAPAPVALPGTILKKTVLEPPKAEKKGQIEKQKPRSKMITNLKKAKKRG